ncbi:hypothetical protein A8709_02355 [Paenibacillus pectinilyticus]|uniref:Uncharacterized protein n=1 Tax=Paenibacillus pectinilyticus TaxID=512399 RepID=A0A1C1A6V4_9BACL|nr:hypothetical protein [Paenibacillus pectinilyticus]OCT16295.1 hypothetical protein A8709_02355 [Paenibacillus pectinilyticus]
MKKLLSKGLACKIIIAMNTIILMMHVLILLRILPADFVWGGRVYSESDVTILESISIVVQALFILIIAVKAGYLLHGHFKRTVHAAIWVMFGFMVLNTLGNLASNSSMETIIMTPLTGVLALLLFRLGIEK